MLSSDNNKNFTNEMNLGKNLYNQNKKNYPLMKNKKVEEPIYVMTVELEKGKNESIKIFSNSKPGELAYDFCKNHNLDFSSLSYLTEEITNLFKNFPKDKKEKNLENEPIEEVDEEEYALSLENTYKKKKNNLEIQQLNTNNNDNNVNAINYNEMNNNNIFENNLNEKQKDFQIMDLNNNQINGEQLDFQNKGKIDLVDDFDNFGKDIIPEEENKNESINLDLEFENENENNNNNINNNIIDINDVKNEITDYKNINSNEDQNKKLKRDITINEEEKNLKENFEFYKTRKKVISYEQFFNNFKKNLKTQPNFFKRKIKNNYKLNKEYKSFNLDIKRVSAKNPIENNIENISNNNNYLLTETFSENSMNIKEKLKSNLKKTKKINKSLLIQNNQDFYSNNPINLENFITNSGALDEVYQNRINDESIFLSKLKLPIYNNINHTKITLQDFTDLCNINSIHQNPSLKQFKISYSSQHKKSNKNIFRNLPKSERNKNYLYKNKKSRIRIGNDNIKNKSFSPSLTSSNINSKNKLLLNNNEIINNSLSKTNNKYQKKNSYKKFKSYNYSHDKKIKSQNKNDDINNLTKNDKIDKIDIKNILQKVFILLDFENKGYIDLNNSKINQIPIQIIIILSTIFNKTRNKNHISKNEFINIGYNLFNTIPFEDQRTLFKFSSNN